MTVKMGHFYRVEMILQNKGPIDDDIVRMPVRMPTPAHPASPSDKDRAYDNPGTPPAPITTGWRRRIIPDWIGVPKGCRTPNPKRVIIRHINHVRIGWLDDNDSLAILGFIRNFLLLGRGQFAGILSPCAHPLDGIHDIGLARQKRISQIGGPGDVLIHALEHIRERNERLNAGVPALFLSGTD